MADESTPQLRPFRVRLERFRQDEAFVIVDARDEDDAKAVAARLAPKLNWTYVACGVAAAIAPLTEQGADA